MELSDAERRRRIDRLGQPLVPRDDAGPRTFHLGLVLSGTVSAGAWTAGVLDMLFEVLDAWEGAKRAGRDVPGHTVRIDVVGGASGGGVCAALLARAATCRFPPVRRAADATTANPFWNVWVESLDIAGMLGTTDLDAEDAVVAALLDGRPIDEAVNGLLGWRPGSPPAVKPLERPRAWLADPFATLLTLTNLRGMPYRMPMAPDGSGVDRATWRIDHADHALFSVARTQGAAILRGDAFPIGPDLGSGRPDWGRLGQYAKATAAFPGGFPSRRLERPLDHYRWRATVLPAELRGGVVPSAKLVLRQPYWAALRETTDAPPFQPNEPYRFDCVDGGALNNQPIELVRGALAGLGKSLPRSGEDADAAVLLIEPLAANPERPAPTDAPTILGVAGTLVGAWVAQSRHATAELALALDDEVYSRFMLTAARPNPAGGPLLWGTAALATGGLEGFLGFFRREWRVHDYLLGRRNCAAYLKNHFTLPATNALFTGDPAAQEFRGRDRPGQATQLQIIPVLPEVMEHGDAPAWPASAPIAPSVEAGMRDRLRAVTSRLAVDLEARGLLAALAARAVAGLAAPRIIAAVDEAREDAEL